MEKRAQGAIEYLLIIGAAVIIAVIVIAVMMGLSTTGTEGAAEASEGVEGQYDEALDIRDCELLDDCTSTDAAPVYADGSGNSAGSRPEKPCHELTPQCAG